MNGTSGWYGKFVSHKVDFLDYLIRTIKSFTELGAHLMIDGMLATLLEFQPNLVMFLKVEGLLLGIRILFHPILVALKMDVQGLDEILSSLQLLIN